MGIMWNKIKFSLFAFDKKLGLKDYSVLKINNSIKLKSLLINENIVNGIKSGRTPSKKRDDYWNGNFDFLVMQDVDTSIFTLKKAVSDKITLKAILEEKTLYKAPKNSLIVSNAMTLGLAFTTDRELYINQNVFHLSIDNKKANILFLKWYFNLILKPIFQKIYASKYLSKDEFAELEIPNIDIVKQNKIAQKIIIIEKEITELQKQKKEPLEIINEVFTKELKFNISEYKKLDNDKYHKVSFSNINTPLLRTTFVQNSHKSLFLKDFLKDNSIFLKDIITKPIKRGKQPIYKDNGIKVIKTINIKEGEINFDEVEYVSNQFYTSNAEKAGVKKYDLLLSSTGMGRGKFALYTDDEPCFADSHISIIRFDYEYINPMFLNYYCQSFFGTEQLKYIEMHIKGTPEIYEAQLNYFQIPILKIEKQEKTVKEISEKLDAQKNIDKEIQRKQNKISELIEKTIKEN